jgi:hypothetical protein
MKPTLLSAGLALAWLTTSAIAGPSITSATGGSLRVGSAHLAPAAGGSYVSGSVETAPGYAAPSTPHVHIAVYDTRGRLVAQETTTLSRNSLVRSHLQPSPRAPYAVFLPEDSAHMARIVVSAEGGHPASR